MSLRWLCPAGHSGSGRLPLPTCPVCGLPVDFVTEKMPAAAPEETLVGAAKKPAPGGPANQRDLIFLQGSVDQTLDPSGPATDRLEETMSRTIERPSGATAPLSSPPSSGPITWPISQVSQDATLERPSAQHGGPSSNGAPTEMDPPHGETLVKPTAAPTGGPHHAGAGLLPIVKGYEILGVLGKGGMGVVYKARQTALNRLVALKMILHGGHASVEDLIRFKIEAEAVASLKHPNIVQIYDIDERDGRPFFALEYLEGGSLQGRLKGEPLSPRTAAVLLEKLARAMDFAHQHGIVHRDLKPANILIAEPPAWPLETVTPKVTDFGLAKRIGAQDQGQTNTEAVLGTPTYMAPEQAASSKAVGPPADVYGLGAILYDCLTGRPPFKGTTVLDTLQMVQKSEPVAPVKLNKSLPLDLQTICLKCLEKDPARRYGSAKALADDLRRFLDGQPIEARRVGTLERTWKWAKRSPTLAALVAMLVLAPIAIATVSTVAYFKLDAASTKIFEANKELEKSNKDLARSEGETKIAMKKETKALEQVKAEMEKVEEQRNRAERERGEAERTFLLAQQAVNQLILLAQMRLKNEPGSEEVRKGLLRDGVRVCQAFVDRPGTEPAGRLRAAKMNYLLGDLQVRLGENAKADASFQEAIKLYKGLLADGEKAKIAGEDYEAEIKKTKVRLAELLQGREPEKAGKVLDELVADLDRESTEKGTDPNFRLVRAVVLANRAIHLQLNRQRGKALKDYDEAARELAGLQDLREAPLELARVEANRSAFYLTGAPARGPAREVELAKAARAGKRAVADLKDLVNKNDQDTDAATELGRAYTNLGRVHVARDDMGEAREVYAEAVELFEKMHKKQPQYVDYTQHLANALGNQGLQFFRDKKPRAATAALERGRKMLAELAADFTDVPVYRQDLARLCTSQGVMRLRSLRDGATPQETATVAAEAREPLTEARRLLREAIELAPDNEEAKSDLAAVEQNLLVCIDRQARAAGERKDWKKAEAHVKELARMREKRVKALPMLSAGATPFERAARAGEALLARAELVGTLRALGNVRELRDDHKGAAETVAKLREYLPADYPGWIDSASLLSRCVRLAEADRSLDPAARAKAADAYGKEALALMAGMKRTAEWKEALEGDDFAPLRERPSLREEYRRLTARKKNR